MAEREAAIEHGVGGGKVASIKGRRLSAREVCPFLYRSTYWIVDVMWTIAIRRIQGNEGSEWKDSTADKVDLDESDCG